LAQGSQNRFLLSDLLFPTRTCGMGPVGNLKGDTMG
jgi:hypothetical protein